jgi:hypothetical protein
LKGYTVHSSTSINIDNYYELCIYIILLSEKLYYDLTAFSSFNNEKMKTNLKCIVFVQGEKIQTILKAANVEVEPYWPGLFAKALEGISVKDLITNVGSGAGAAPAAAGQYSYF